MINTDPWAAGLTGNEESDELDRRRVVGAALLEAGNGLKVEQFIGVLGAAIGDLLATVTIREHRYAMLAAIAEALPERAETTRLRLVGEQAYLDELRIMPQTAEQFAMARRSDIGHLVERLMQEVKELKAQNEKLQNDLANEYAAQHHSRQGGIVAAKAQR